MSAPQLDELDQQLIELLARDARVSNRKIAVDLGVTEGLTAGWNGRFGFFLPIG